MTKKRLVIGIDPDVDKSGVAVIDLHSGEINLMSLTFAEMMIFFQSFKDDKSVEVIVEAGWMVKKSNYHAVYGSAGQRVAKNVGENHRRGKDIVEMLEALNIPHREVLPLRKSWRGQDRKITHEEFCQICSYKGRTNQETRDAGLLAWINADMPLNIRNRDKKTIK